ncbi:MAG: peptidoglycan DD-metalloendopeptidase family protein [Campylobacter sp.]|nr:peptidoglycan DD-metalloendopeptidase family protein [Campylobacter sp.]
MSKQLNKKLEDLADDIVLGDKNLKSITKDTNALKSQISSLEKDVKSQNKELESLSAQNKELLENQKQIEQNLIRIIAEDFSMDLFMQDSGVSDSIDSIVASETISKLGDVLKDDFKKMAKNYDETLNLIRDKSQKIDQIQANIKDYKKKQNDLLGLQKKQKSTLENLRRDKEIYSKKLQKLKSQQDELRKTLEHLNILAKRESEAAREAKKQRKSAEKSRQKSGKKAQEEVSQLNTAYKSSVIRYRGAKTIAPLESYSVKQKFGNYVDPIYNIKIFNENVVLRSKTTNAMVRSVLNGKVVFAKETPLLDNVVIVENDGQIHTIYAHLSHIAPTIRVGTRVKKGTIIGRVRQDLTFEVTQKNAHINPLELISR